MSNPCVELMAIHGYASSMIPTLNSSRCVAFWTLWIALASFSFTFPVVAQNTWPTERPDNLDETRPIRSEKKVFLEEMTWMEVRDAIQNGTDRILVPTGGIEQNGPYLALGKHNYVLRRTMEALAHRMGHTLIAPIVPFVPEGGFNPPSHHLRYPGTIGVRAETFESLLEDIAGSLRLHGFKRIIFLGDSGDNQVPMKNVADRLDKDWKDVQVLIEPEYYRARRSLRPWLEKKGYMEVDDGYHDSLRYTAIMMTIHPELVRFAQRKEAGRNTINGISLEPKEKIISLGWDIIDFEVTHTLEALKKQSILPAYDLQ